MLLTQNSPAYSSMNHRLLNQNQKMIAQSVERLASAKRINTAKDDVAGLSIHTRLEQQTRTAAKERANLQEQVSFAQSAQGTLSTVQDHLMRLREMAVQASTVTLSEQDRKALNNEKQDILASIDELSQTKFNQKQMFGASYNFETTQTNANPSGITRLDLSDLESNNLIRVSQNRSREGVNAFVSWNTGDIRLGKAIRVGPDPVIGNQGYQVQGGVEVRATQASDDTVSTEYNAGSAIAKAAAINDSTDEHGVTAKVEATVAKLVINENINLSQGNQSFEVNGLKVSNLYLVAGDRNHTLINYLNEFTDRTGVVASKGEGNEVLLTAEDGRNIVLEAALFGGRHILANQLGFFENQKASFQYDRKVVVGGKLSLFSEQDYTLFYDNPIMNESMGLIHEPSRFNERYLGAHVDSGGQMIYNQTGEFEGGPFYNAYTEDPDSLIPNMIKSITGALEISTLDNFESSLTSNFFDMDGPLELINSFLTTNYIEQRNYRESLHPQDPNFGHKRIIYGQAVNRVNFNNYARSTYFLSGLRLEFDASQMSLIDMERSNVADAVDAFKMTIFEPIYEYGNNARSLVDNRWQTMRQGLVQMSKDKDELSVTQLDFSTQAGALESLKIIDQALNEVSSNQTNLSALQNSLEHSMSRVENTQIALSQADEKIVSADFAVETAELTRAQIKQGLGQKLLSKVNIDSYLALALVRSGRR